MCSKAIPLQPGNYMQPNFPGVPGLMGRNPVGEYNYNASIAAVKLVQRQQNQAYIPQPVVLNTSRRVNNHVLPTHSSPNPRFDNYLAGIHPNRGVQSYQQRPRQRDRSSPPDSFKSGPSRSSSDRSGEHRLPSSGQPNAGQNSFRPCCRQKTTEIRIVDPNTTQHPFQQKSSKLSHSNSQRRIRDFSEKKLDCNLNKAQHQPLGYPKSAMATAAPQKQSILDQGKPDKLTSDCKIPARQRRNRKSTKQQPESPASDPVKCAPMQAIENEMAMRKSRPRRIKRSEVTVHANEGYNVAKQK